MQWLIFILKAPSPSSCIPHPSSLFVCVCARVFVWVLILFVFCPFRYSACHFTEVLVCPPSLAELLRCHCSCGSLYHFVHFIWVPSICCVFVDLSHVGCHGAVTECFDSWGHEGSHARRLFLLESISTWFCSRCNVCCLCSYCTVLFRCLTYCASLSLCMVCSSKKLA